VKPGLVLLHTGEVGEARVGTPTYWRGWLSQGWYSYIPERLVKPGLVLLHTGEVGEARVGTPTYRIC
jgi:hypothetical protein